VLPSCVQVMGKPLRIKETPTNQLYQAFEEAGTDLAQVGVAAFVHSCVHCI
jgi:hypothetical protein